MSRFKDILPYFFALNYFNHLHNSGNMGKPTASAEQVEAWCKKNENRNKENERKKERYHVKKKELTEEERDKKENMTTCGKKNCAKIKVDKKFNVSN